MKKECWVQAPQQRRLGIAGHWADHAIRELRSAHETFAHATESRPDADNFLRDGLPLSARKLHPGLENLLALVVAHVLFDLVPVVRKLLPGFVNMFSEHSG